MDGIPLGEGEGIKEGLGDGKGVVGGGVGWLVGIFVGLHVVHKSVKLLGVPVVCPDWKTCQGFCNSGGVLLQALASPPNAAITESPAITQLSPCSRS